LKKCPFYRLSQELVTKTKLLVAISN